MDAPPVRPKRLRRLLKWGGALLAAVLVLQAGGTFLLNRWVESSLGSEAGTLDLRLWSLRVQSREGSGRVGPFEVRWQGLVYSQFNGRLSFESLSLGEEARPLVEARGMSIRKVFGAPEVRVKTLRIDTSAPGWSDLADLFETRQEGGAAPRPSFALWIETLALESPLGSASGPLRLDLSETETRVAFDLTGEERTHLKGEGRAEGSGGEFFISGALQRSPFQVAVSGREGIWRCQGALEGQFSSWTMDGELRGADTAKILMQQRGRAEPFPWVLLTWEDLKAQGGYIPTLEMAEEGIRLASLDLGLPSWLSSGNIAAHTFKSDLYSNGNRKCFSLQLQSGTGGSGEGQQLAYAANLNWDSGGGSSLLFEVRAGNRGGAPLPFFGKSLHFGGLLEGLFEPEKSVLGVLQSTSTQLQVRGAGSTENGSGNFGGRHEKMFLSGSFSWSNSGFQGEIQSQGPFPRSPDWPLPDGNWSTLLQAEFPKDAPPSAHLDATGARGAKIRGTMVDGLVHLEGTGLSLGAGWGHIEGFTLSGDSQWSDFAKMPVNTRFRGHAESAKAGDAALAHLVFAGRQEGSALFIDTSVDLPDLQGAAMGSWNLPLDSPGDVALIAGEAKLLDGQLSATGLRAGDFFRETERWLRWSASAATVSGEPLSDLEGDCGPGEDGNFTARGAGRGLGGRVAFEVHPAADQRALTVEASDMEAGALTRFLSRFQALPFSLSAGKVGLSVQAPLTAFGPGWVARLHPKGVTALVPDDRHQFRGLGGTVLVRALTEGVQVESEGLSLEEGRVPVALEGEVGGTESALRFLVPLAPARDVQNALFDFLPEFVGYGEVMGRLGLEGVYQPEGTTPGFQVKARFDGASFTSEDRSLVLDGLEGTLALAVGTGGKGPALPGFRSPPREAVNPVVEEFSRALVRGESLAVKSITFSVYGLSDVHLSTQGGADGVTRLRLTKGTLWDGPVRAEVGLAITAADIRYAGQVVMDHASLREFCRESEGLTGFLGGRFSGSLTFRGDRMGLGALKALVDIAVDPAGDEPLVLGRDFLVNVGGAPMKKLVTRRFQEYDEASLTVGIRGGSMTVQNLVLAHQANPFKSLLRKDLSFELRVPLNNSISLYSLLDLVKSIGASSATVETP